MSRRGRAATVAAVCLGLALAPASAADWNVQATASPPRLAVGRTTTYCVTVTAVRAGDLPAALEVSPPVLGAGLVAASARYQSRQWVAGAYRQTCCWTLRADRQGTSRIEPATVRLLDAHGVWRLLPGPAVSVRITAPVPTEATATPLPSPRPPGRTPFQNWILVGLVLAILVAAASSLLWLRQADEADGANAPEGPEAAVIDQLERVRDGLDETDLERSYANLAAGLYTYLAEKADRPSAALTTAEARALLPRLAIPTPTREAILAALQLADEVRFARESATEGETRALLERLILALGRTGKD